MSGSGNDFVVIDNRQGALREEELPAFARRICHRRLSVGADGLLLVEDSEQSDFKWRIFNADGSEAEMCGNGGRCVARFAYLGGAAGKTMSMETLAGQLKAEVLDERVKLQMTSPTDIKLDVELPLKGGRLVVHRVNTGVPHAVHFVEDLDTAGVAAIGREVRFHPTFQPAGTNVNFVSLLNRSRLALRTYERGVEDETLSCGTGSVASALIAFEKGFVEPPVTAVARSGDVLTIHFEKGGSGYEGVFLEGDARVIYRGELT
jgi:diaminopimelate epimerase